MLDGADIKARVLEVSQPRVVATRFGFYANVTNVLVTDETGTIQLPLWNKQIAVVPYDSVYHVVLYFRYLSHLLI